MAQEQTLNAMQNAKGVEEMGMGSAWYNPLQSGSL